ncbi:unnamed protein product, partial [Scytosiphon promiscuus]
MLVVGKLHGFLQQFQRFTGNPLFRRQAAACRLPVTMVRTLLGAQDVNSGVKKSFISREAIAMSRKQISPHWKLKRMQTSAWERTRPAQGMPSWINACVGWRWRVRSFRHRTQLILIPVLDALFLIT